MAEHCSGNGTREFAGWHWNDALLTRFASAAPPSVGLPPAPGDRSSDERSGDDPFDPFLDGLAFIPSREG